MSSVTSSALTLVVHASIWFIFTVLLQLENHVLGLCRLSYTSAVATNSNSLNWNSNWSKESKLELEQETQTRARNSNSNLSKKLKLEQETQTRTQTWTQTRARNSNSNWRVQDTRRHAVRRLAHAPTQDIYNHVQLFTLFTFTNLYNNLCTIKNDSPFIRGHRPPCATIFNFTTLFATWCRK